MTVYQESSLRGIALDISEAPNSLPSCIERSSLKQLNACREWVTVLPLCKQKNGKEIQESSLRGIALGRRTLVMRGVGDKHPAVF